MRNTWLLSDAQALMFIALVVLGVGAATVWIGF